MKPFRILSFASAIFLVGCATAMPNWSKAGATKEQIRQDFSQCKDAAEKAEFIRSMRLNPKQQEIDSCMRGKGYQPTK